MVTFLLVLAGYSEQVYMLSPRGGIAQEADPYLGQNMSTRDGDESLLAASRSLTAAKTTEIRCAANLIFGLDLCYCIIIDGTRTYTFSFIIIAILFRAPPLREKYELSI